MSPGVRADQAAPAPAGATPAIFLMGPTAVGKTALALALRERLPVEIISVDSSQVYRGLDIGTAKPTPQEQARAPHRLIDIRDPAQPYSVAEFCRDARAEMDAIRASGRIPLLVGGTMFYFHALEFGLPPLPGADPALRARLQEQGERLGWPALHRRLQAMDPQAAARIAPHDRQRIQRALEVLTLTGNLPPRPSRMELPDYALIKVAVVPSDRRWLHGRIAQRFQAMLEQGLVAEVERLWRRGDLDPRLPAVRTVGYRQVWDYLTGILDYYQMVERGIAGTRQLAKRQLTWLRRYPGVQSFDSGAADEAHVAVTHYLYDRLPAFGL